jgi:hypothetical protein
MSDRDERYQRVLDAEYEIWRAGGNPDSLDRDRAHEQAYDHTGEEIARAHLRHEREAREAREMSERQEQEEMDAMCAEEQARNHYEQQMEDQYLADQYGPPPPEDEPKP